MELQSHVIFRKAQTDFLLMVKLSLPYEPMKLKKRETGVDLFVSICKISKLKGFQRLPLQK